MRNPRCFGHDDAYATEDLSDPAKGSVNSHLRKGIHCLESHTSRLEGYNFVRDCAHFQQDRHIENFC